MLSREENELLTRVEGRAPMGRMIRPSLAGSPQIRRNCSSIP